jgi:hypothetical protein
MTPQQAAEVFKKITAEQAQLAPTMRQAKKVLNQHFDDAGVDELDGVKRAVDVREQLDADAVRDFLGDRVGEFTKSVTSRTLYLEKGPK